MAKVYKRILGTVVTAAVLAVLLLMVRTGLVEQQVAAALRAQYGLPSDNRMTVTVSPQPVWQLVGLASDPQVDVNCVINDLAAANLGTINVVTKVTGITQNMGSLATATNASATFTSAQREIYLFENGLAEQLGLSLLQLSNLEDISPAAGTLDRVKIQGKLGADATPAIVEAQLLLEQGTLKIVPQKVVAAAGHPEAEIISKFSWSYPSTQLPLLGEAVSFTVSSHSLLVKSELAPTTFDLKMLAPTSYPAV